MINQKLPFCLWIAAINKQTNKLANYISLCFFIGASSDKFLVTQSSDVSVREGETVNIACCLTGEFERATVTWLKNQTSMGHEILMKKPESSLQKNTSDCSNKTFINITREDSERYTCKVNIEIPFHLEVKGNGTVITVMARDNAADNTGEGMWQNTTNMTTWCCDSVSFCCVFCPVLFWNQALVCLLLLLSFSCVFFLQCFSFHYHTCPLSSSLTSSVLLPVISVSVYSLCPPSCHCQFVLWCPLWCSPLHCWSVLFLVSPSWSVVPHVTHLMCFWFWFLTYRFDLNFAFLFALCFFSLFVAALYFVFVTDLCV